MNRGDIYLVSLDPTLGHEQQGSRPVLIVSPTAFNQLTKLPIICPITTRGDFAKRNGVTVQINTNTAI
jgi:mRNA interferase ChpB